MRHFIFFTLILSLNLRSSAQQQTTDFYPILPSPVRTQIPCSYEGYYEDSQDCAKFYRCVDYGVENGVRLLYRHEFQCAPGTVYDRYKGICNHVNRVKLSPSCQAQLLWGRVENKYAPTFQSTYNPYANNVATNVATSNAAPNPYINVSPSPSPFTFTNSNPFANLSPSPRVSINGNYNPSYNPYTPTSIEYLPVQQRNENQDNALTTDIEISPYFLRPQALVAKEDSGKALAKLFAKTSYYYSSQPYVQYQVQVPYSVNSR